MKYFAALAAFAFAGAADAADSVLLTGCHSLTFDEETGLMANAEILPMMQIPGSTASAFYSVSTPGECQEKCSANPLCEYFTLRENKQTHERVCILKPAPSLASSPLMQVRVFDETATYSYTSGMSKNAKPCTDGAQLVTGCGGSSPGSCALLGAHVSFNETCLHDSKLGPHCGVQGYTCCVNCDLAGSAACCGRNKRLSGYVLAGGSSVSDGIAAHVRSAEECWARCYGTTGCTHWNFVTTASSQALWGGCYLKSYEDPSKPHIEIAPKFAESSIVGAVDCEKDYGLDNPPTPTPSPDPSKPTGGSTNATTKTGAPVNKLGGDPIEGTCFESHVDIAAANLFSTWSQFSAEGCQSLCQKFPSCVAFVYDTTHNACFLKYSAAKTQRTENGELIAGFRDCPGAEKAPAVNSCIKTDTDIKLDDLSAVSATHAYACWEKCSFHEGCGGWSYKDDQCYLKSGSTPTEEGEGIASGAKDCPSFPFEAARRRLGGPLVPQIAPKHFTQEELNSQTAGPKKGVNQKAFRGNVFEVQSVEDLGSTPEPPPDSTTSTITTITGPDVTPHITSDGSSTDDSSTSDNNTDDTSTSDNSTNSTDPTNPAECYLKNSEIRGPAIETVGGVANHQACHKLCREREDCFYSSYTAAEQLCRYRYNGPIFSKIGTDIASRDCPSLDSSTVVRQTDKRIETAEASVGSSHHYLGAPAEWAVKGVVPDFSKPSGWSRLAVLVLSGSSDQDCFVSDALSSDVDTSCWSEREEILPMRIQLQIIGVAKNAHFPGWKDIPWGGVPVDRAISEGWFELFNQEMNITAETDESHGGHGVWLTPIDKDVTQHWPADMNSPVNFGSGAFYARLQSLNDSETVAKIIFCITGSDEPVAEICSHPLVVPPTSF